jgi:hypothetical protein
LRLTAPVRFITGFTKHFVGTIGDDGTHVPLHELPRPTQIIIDEDGFGYPVLLLDLHGDQVADEWFPTLDDAKRQAKQEFGIDESDWSVVT